MSGYRISEMAGRTGIPATALRYYEDIGVVPPAGRSDAGYRVYDERSVARFEFVAHAKQLGLNLDDVRMLVGLWDGGECAPVQQEMARLVDAKIVEMARRSDELTTFAKELHVIATRLRAQPASGRCGDACACVAPAAADSASPVALVAKRDATMEPVIACTLSNGEEVERRVDDWKQLLADVTIREVVDGGLRLVLPAGEEVVVELCRLVAAELACCSWLDFTLRLTADATVLEVHAPADGQTILALLFGAAA